MQRAGVAVARQPARPADALGLGALPRPHVLRRPGASPNCRAAVGSAGDGARVRLERGLRRGDATTAASATCCSAARVDAERRVAARVAPLRDARSPYGRLLSRAARQQARRAVPAAPPDAARRRHRAALRGRRRRPAPQRRRLGEVPRRRGRRRRRRRLGPGPCARERARRRRHDGDARGRRERPGRRAHAASRRGACAASVRRTPRSSSPR